jgi:hypothetical protein
MWAKLNAKFLSRNLSENKNYHKLKFESNFFYSNLKKNENLFFSNNIAINNTYKSKFVFTCFLLSLNQLFDVELKAKAGNLFL